MALEIKSLKSENESLKEKNIKIDLEIKTLKSENKLVKGKSIKTDFEIIKVNFKLLEENELLRNEKIFNDAYLKVEKKNKIS